MAATKKLILRSQAEAIANWLREAGFDPSEFAWSEVASQTGDNSVVSQLTHVASGYRFLFDYMGNDFYFYCSPGNSTAESSGYPQTWQRLLPFLTQWMGDLRREVDTPDPWGQYLQAADLIREAQESTDNSPFNDAERRDMTRRLEAIRGLLLEAVPNADGQERTNEKLDYLVANAHTQGRRDFFWMATGVLLGTGIQEGLDSDLIRQAFELLLRGVQQLTGG